jgi:Lrp/AsnC family leucine-responsive transcriptional regulator
MTYSPDRTDVRLLELLQRDGRLTNVELAQRVALSASPCLRRVRQLEEAGFIRSYVALVDPQRVGLGLQAYVSVTLDKRRDNCVNAFHDAMQAAPEVLSCIALTGEMDYLLHVAAEDLEHFSRFLMSRLLKLDGVANVKSSFVLQAVKNTTELPLGQLLR